MNLRARLALVVAVVVAASIAAAAALSYQAAAAGLRQQSDEFLEARASRFTNAGLTFDRLNLAGVATGRSPFRFAELDAVTQVLDPSGAVASSVVGEPALPVDGTDVAVARAGEGAQRRDVDVAGQPYRVLTVGLAGGGAVQIARNLGEADRLLAHLRQRLLVAVAAGTAAAAGIALVVAHRTARPIEVLRDTVEDVTASGDLTHPVPIDDRGGREVAQLGTAFNSLLASLARAREQQARLVGDASHELRTPLTAMRTNIEFLERADAMGDDERRALLAETRAEVEELTTLVTEMVELATDTRTVEPVVDVDLRGVCADVAERAGRRSGRTVTVALGRPTVVRAQRGLIERAVANLVDNALKFSDPPASVEITVDGPVVEVADRGCGIDPSDQERVFERFYRADRSRSRPGSGLGLSIVAQIAEGHGAAVSLRPRPGGGTIARLALPEGPAARSTPRS